MKGKQTETKGTRGKFKSVLFLRLPTVVAFAVIGIASVAYTILAYAPTNINEQQAPKGWVWNAYQFIGTNDAIGLGWTSMNCLNDFDNDGLYEYRCIDDYGVEVATTGVLDGSSDYVRGCAWSSAYGWVCFDGGNDNTAYQCSTTAKKCSVSGTFCENAGPDCPLGVGETCLVGFVPEAAACGFVDASGVDILDFPFESGASALFYILKSPLASGAAWADIAANHDQRAEILSLWETGQANKGAIGFPFGDPDRNPDNGVFKASTTDGFLQGCMGCDSSTGKCKSCLTVSTLPEQQTTCSVTSSQSCEAAAGNWPGGGCPAGEFCTSENTNPNLLCWDCGNGNACEIGVQGGSCISNREKNRCLASSCIGGCTNYPGVIVNDVTPNVTLASAKRYELCGWGWHAWDAGSSVTKGLGWVAFNSEASIGDVAYIDVSQGNILSGGSIFAPGAPPVGRFNAAYIIEASGDIINFYSENQYLFKNVADLPHFLAEQGATGVYKNVLGRLDYDGLITNVTTGAVPPAGAVGAKNKYGRSIVSLAPGDANTIFAAANNPLDDRVFYVNGNVTMGAGTFESTAGKSGAGIIVVNGDLTITGSHTYEASSVTKLREVPSTVWVVNGDLSLNIPGACSNPPNPACTSSATCPGGACENSIAGTFIVLGNGTTCPGLGEVSASCGRFATGVGDIQLKIFGSVLSRQFKFERRFNDNGLPSEAFIPEGRLQANTPSGMTDFTKSVPRFGIGG